MKTLTIRDFRTRPRQAQETIRRESETVLTSNGRPVALIVPVDAGTLDAELETLRNARAVRALAALREQADMEGSSAMPPSDLDELIKKSREARRGKKPSRS